ncbi:MULTISPECIES: hypothetical protein, partial [Serratia]|uniref:hypothetical protein n=1 Tax=Serratia TaxID=613 RepID=UPI003316280A
DEPSLIRITDINTHDSFLGTIQFSQIAAAGGIIQRWYMPNHTQYSNGIISSNFMPFYFDDLTLNEFTELTDRYARVRYSLPAEFNLINENNRYRTIDTSGIFKPSYAEKLTSETVSCISAHATKNLVQFFVVLTDVVSAGYEQTQAGVLAYIAAVAERALFMAYSGNYGTYKLREDTFDIIVPPGAYTVEIVGDVGVAATIRQRVKLTFKPHNS